MSEEVQNETKEAMPFDGFVETVLQDYKLGWLSREASLLGRKEVLTGKAKFGIFGDGKELAQIAMAKVFQPGDFRSGYYRDQTFMMAIDALSVQQHFAALYAHTDLDQEPASGGRQMGGHFSTHLLDSDGNWLPLSELKNSSADISPTGGQMARLVGLAQASSIYRAADMPDDFKKFSRNGNEVAFGTIGNAATSEGVFFEAINAMGVLQVPVVMSVWDDQYGISVPSEYQTTKQSISAILSGFQRDEEQKGFEIFTVEGWNYPALIATYEKAARIAREEHVPVLVHVIEVTQPQGHSTSGSHERYKSPERLQWERDFDCLVQFKKWILEKGIADEAVLDELQKEAVQECKAAKNAAWSAFLAPIMDWANSGGALLAALGAKSGKPELVAAAERISKDAAPMRRDIIEAARNGLMLTRLEPSEERNALKDWLEAKLEESKHLYNTKLHSEFSSRATEVAAVVPKYDEQSEEVDARLLLRENFAQLLEHRPEVLIFGEDSGKIGDVNQGLEGLQERFGVHRVSDTGIREATIVGQGIGMAMRGLRPIAEIQYLDYLLYALQTLSDDLATLHYRTAGTQRAPLIIRTRGHRLEGIWHSGSPMGMIIHALRGIHVLVPRNMTIAAGFYNTLLDSDEPGLIVECLNGYRLKEKMPSNLSEIRSPIGTVERIREGEHITVLTYGSTCRVVMEAAERASHLGIELEVIDAQSLLPFDLEHNTVKSLEHTNRLMVVDEDVPGGASAYLLQKVLEEQGGYIHLDHKPITVTSKAHRPAYSSDGDYFSKPSSDDVLEAAYAMMHECDPAQFPAI